LTFFHYEVIRYRYVALEHATTQLTPDIGVTDVQNGRMPAT